ncbi:NTP transferase domain-containing protein [Kribbella sp. NPDC056861]|uniref:nucleotidyltransferase family protein n=1 Tax=Kribbella sp. NPDC056861 TaxID=3154857 RepID=UPI00343E52DC
MTLLGVLLAAGPGTRLGGPAALQRHPDGMSWAERSVEVMRAAGCDRIAVVVGASAPEVAALLADSSVVTVPSDWQLGLSASVRAGLTWALAQPDAEVALLHMVNKPDITTPVLRRVLTAAGAGPDALARAALADHATHPVVLGRTHWQPAHDAAHGDRSAGPYLKRVPCPLVPCDDLL